MLDVSWVTDEEVGWVGLGKV